MSETPERTRSSASGMGRVPSRVWVALVLIVLAVVFIAENRELTAIRLIIPVVVMPLWVALAGLFVVGLVAGYWLGRRRRK